MSTTPTRAKRRRQVRIASKLKVPLPRSSNGSTSMLRASTSDRRSTGPLFLPAAIAKGRTCAASGPLAEICALWPTGSSDVRSRR